MSYEYENGTPNPQKETTFLSRKHVINFIITIILLPSCLLSETNYDFIFPEIEINRDLEIRN